MRTGIDGTVTPTELTKNSMPVISAKIPSIVADNTIMPSNCKPQRISVTPSNNEAIDRPFC